MLVLLITNKISDHSQKCMDSQFKPNGNILFNNLPFLKDFVDIKS